MHATLPQEWPVGHRDPLGHTQVFSIFCPHRPFYLQTTFVEVYSDLLTGSSQSLYWVFFFSFSLLELVCSAHCFEEPPFPTPQQHLCFCSLTLENMFWSSVVRVWLVLAHWSFLTPGGTPRYTPGTSECVMYWPYWVVHVLMLAPGVRGSVGLAGGSAGWSTSWGFPWRVL